MLAGNYDATYVLPNGYLSAGSASKLFTLAEGDHQDIYFPVEVKTPYDLQVQKTVDKLTAHPGEMLNYTLTVQNLGNTFEGKNILVRDTLPNGLVYVGSTSSYVSYEDAGDRVRRIPSLAAGAIATISFQAQVSSSITTATTLTNAVKLISGSPTDTNPLNDTADISTSITIPTTP